MYRHPIGDRIDVCCVALRRADNSDPKRLFFLATLLYHAGRLDEAEGFYRQAGPGAFQAPLRPSIGLR